MQYIFDNLGIIIFIGFIIMSAVFNSVGSIIKKSAEAAENSKGHQKRPRENKPLGEESAEEFFTRMQNQQKKPAKKLKLSKKANLQPESQSSFDPFDSLEDRYEDAEEKKYKFEAPDKDDLASIPVATRSKQKKSPKINTKDKRSIRKAIIISEVLGRPSAYKY